MSSAPGYAGCSAHTHARAEGCVCGGELKGVRGGGGRGELKVAHADARGYGRA